MNVYLMNNDIYHGLKKKLILQNVFNMHDNRYYGLYDVWKIYIYIIYYMRKS